MSKYLMITNNLHLRIFGDLKSLVTKNDQKLSAWVQHYLGSDKPTLLIKNDLIHKMAKDIVKNDIHSHEDLINLLDSMYSHGTYVEELTLAASIFGQSKKLRDNFDLKNLDNWLSHCRGWVQVDSLCQNNFTAQEVLDNWSKWQSFLLRLSDNKNINKRRASLVLLCKSLRLSDDKRLFNFGIEIVEKLKWEKEVLITKAISWILRSMVKNFPDEVGEYLDKNQITLPRIAYRETLKKLTTGRKN